MIPSMAPPIPLVSDFDANNTLSIIDISEVVACVSLFRLSVFVYFYQLKTVIRFCCPCSEDISTNKREQTLHLPLRFSFNWNLPTKSLIKGIVNQLLTITELVFFGFSIIFLWSIGNNI